MIVPCLRRAALLSLVCATVACTLAHPAADQPDGSANVPDTATEQPDTAVPRPDAPVDEPDATATPDVAMVDDRATDAPDAVDATPDAMDASDASSDVAASDADARVDGAVTDADASRDATVIAVDAAPGNAAFGDVCVRDLDCASGHCLSIGRCTRACSGASPCPASSNWACLGTIGTAPLCQCTVRSTIDTCNGVDDDCNGRIDDPATATCTAPFVCSVGQCRCPGALSSCTGRCLDLSSDATSCGTCDHACPVGAVCTGGVCACRAGQSLCEGACVDTQSDALRCGGCNTRCSVACSSGSCVTASTVTAGAAHSCAVMSDGTGRCWGFDSTGALGDDGAFTGRPTTVLGLSTITQLSAGGVVDSTGTLTGHTCARLADATVSCWGGNASGQVGNGTLTDVTHPAAITGLTGVVQVSAGGNHTCALHASGAVQCWGDNTFGQLGESAATTTQRSSPGPMLALPIVASISAGATHTCAVTTSGAVYCWGDNATGQLGDALAGSGTPRLVTLPPTMRLAAQVEAGTGHTCVLGTDSAVVCWGADTSGQVGNGATPDTAPPTVITTPSRVTALSTGGQGHDLAPFGFSCARISDGTVRCWGVASQGQLGDSSSLTSPNPVAVTGLTNAASIAAGGAHACATTSSGLVYCWGNDALGQLGDGHAGHQSAPVAVQW